MNVLVLRCANMVVAWQLLQSVRGQKGIVCLNDGLRIAYSTDKPSDVRTAIAAVVQHSVLVGGALLELSQIVL